MRVWLCAWLAVFALLVACSPPQDAKPVPAPAALPADLESPAERLDPWLVAHPRIAEHLVYYFDGAWQPYPAWPDDARAALTDAVARQSLGESLALPDPPANQAEREDHQHPLTLLTKPDARDLYISLVARSLLVELRQDVPWSVTTYGARSLELLFDGRVLFAPLRGGMVVGMYWSMPSPPDVVASWLQRESIVGSSKRETIENLLLWSRANLVHFVGPYTLLNAELHWQYRGPPPVSRILQGTHYEGQDLPPHDKLHFAAGCHGTVAWMHSVLRVANIPVEYLRLHGNSADRHGQARFPTEGLYLPHGDDPYSFPLDAVPIGELLIDEPTWRASFGPDVPAQTVRNNRVSRPCRLAEHHLSDHLLRERCKDDGERNIYAMFPCFTEEQLIKRRLIARIDDRLEAIGGCTAIPPPRALTMFRPQLDCPPSAQPEG